MPSLPKTIQYSPKITTTDLPDISHFDLDDIGTNTHDQIDTHIADGTIHFTEGSIDHGNLLGLSDDDHAQYALLAGRAGGQTLNGSPTNGEDLDLQGNPGANPGFINANSPIIFGPYTGNPAAAYGFDYSVVDNPIGGFVGGGLNFSGTISMTNSTFIYESFRGAPSITTNVNPGFAAYTVMQALPQLISGSGAGHNPLSALIINAGATAVNGFSGTRTIPSLQGMNFASGLNATVSGAVMNCTTFTGLNVAPVWSTVAGSTVSFGNVTAVHLRRPAQSLFGGSGGIERMSSYYGLQVQNPTISNGFGTMPCAAVRSEILAGTNRYFLLNTGTAPTDHGAAHMYFDDGFGTVFGGNGITNFDAWFHWNAGRSALAMTFASTFDALDFSSPAADTFLITSNAGSNNEIRFDFDRFNFGQGGAVGNQIGVFTANARTTQVGGEWVDWLMTSSNNLTIDHAMGAVYGWGVNAPAMVLGTGTVTTAGVLNVGGNVTQGSVNRFGLRILSNPAGGSGVNAALWVTAGRSQFDGIVDINNGVALGGGAAATLGTIGGAGPTAAAQAQWVQIEVNGVNHWIPAWT